MKRLLLLRHAKSSWDDPALADHDRPLAKRGRRAARVIAEHMRETAVDPDLVLCSSAVRARQTLERITPALGAETVVRFERRLYAASETELLDAVRELGHEAESMMLIGHNPGMEHLAALLSRAGPELERLEAKFPTAALATLEFTGPWSELAPGAAELVEFVKPRELEG